MSPQIRPYPTQCHRQNQPQVNGVPLNPVLPPHFFTAPFDERDPKELEDWLDRPFMQTIHWSHKEVSYREDRARGLPDAYDEGHWTPDWWAAEGDDASFEATLVALKARWFATFPTGNQYAVWVLSKDVIWASGDESGRPPVGLLGYCANVEDAVKLANAKLNSNDLYNAEINSLRVQYWENPTPFEEY